MILNKMVTKYIITLFIVALRGALAETCKRPRVEDAVFTSSNERSVAGSVYVTRFTLKCDNELPATYDLYAEVDGNPMPAQRIGKNRYQLSWALRSFRAPSGSVRVSVVDEGDWAELKRARRFDPAAQMTPLFVMDLHYPKQSSGSRTDVALLATVPVLLVAYRL